MSETEELIFGLNRYIKKASTYVGSKSESEFIRDQMAFDATCFCFYMIDYIVKKILEHKDLINEYKEIDFVAINTYKDEIFLRDNLDYMRMYEIIQNEFPLLQIKLGNRLGTFTYGK